MRSARYLAPLWVILFFIGCGSYSIMPNHDPNAILKDKTARVVQEIPSLKGKTIVLELVADLSTQPTGSCLDDKLDSITNVNLSYLIPCTGYVFFEKIADSMKGAEAVVFRRYPGTATKSVKIPADARHLALTMKSVEFHQFRNSKSETRYLVSAVISCRIGGVNSAEEIIRVNANVPSDRDGFVVLADRFVAAVAPRL